MINSLKWLNNNSFDPFNGSIILYNSICAAVLHNFHLLNVMPNFLA